MKKSRTGKQSKSTKSKKVSRTREAYLAALQESRDKKYDNELRKLSPEDRMYGDPPDEPRYTKEEHFADAYDSGTKPEDFADAKERAEYVKWLKALESMPSEDED